VKQASAGFKDEIRHAPGIDRVLRSF